MLVTLSKLPKIVPVHSKFSKNWFIKKAEVEKKGKDKRGGGVADSAFLAAWVEKKEKGGDGTRIFEATIGSNSANYVLVCECKITVHS